MMLYNVPWIPRYVPEAQARIVLATAVMRSAGHAWTWLHAR